MGSRIASFVDSAPAKPRRPVPNDYVFVAAIGSIVLAAFAVLCPNSPERVDRLTVSNPTPFAMTVEVRDQAGAWMPAAIVDHESSATRDESVIDVGDEWTFRFSAQGRYADTVTLTRSELESQRWTLVVDPTIAQAFTESEARPSP
jgi:hypothetical protein